MSDFRIDKITNRVGDAGTQIAGITTFSGTSGMQLPVGPTEHRGGRGTGLIAGGIYSGARQATIEKLTIATTGNTTNFGSLTQSASQGAGFSDSTRAVFGGGTPSTPAGTTNIDFVTISSGGGASDFGSFKIAGFSRIGASNNTRGIFFGRVIAPQSFNNIEYVTIATTGDATDFGDTALSISDGCCCASTTRGIHAGGNHYGTGPDGRIQWRYIGYVNIASRGDSIDFGEAIANIGNQRGGLSSPTRGIFLNGAPSSVNSLEYITMATTGNGTDFGDRTVAMSQVATLSSSIRGVMGGAGEGNNNTIDYITIATTGNATDFGDLYTGNNGYACGASDVHGGLG